MMHTHTCTHAEAELHVDIAHRAYAHPYTHTRMNTQAHVCAYTTCIHSMPHTHTTAMNTAQMHTHACTAALERPRALAQFLGDTGGVPSPWVYFWL